MTFHGVFGWVQQKDNYPVNQYGLKNPGIEPPHHFVYLYRNHYSEAERPCVQFLETLMREQTACAQRKELWRHYTIQDGREYLVTAVTADHDKAFVCVIPTKKERIARKGNENNSPKLRQSK